jgi:tRNA-dihydrouridine synthase
MAEQIARTMKRVAGPDFPITLKMRTGDTSERIAHKIIEDAKDWGVDLITVSLSRHHRLQTRRWPLFRVSKLRDNSKP